MIMDSMDIIMSAKLRYKLKEYIIEAEMELRTMHPTSRYAVNHYGMEFMEDEVPSTLLNADNECDWELFSTKTMSGTLTDEETIYRSMFVNLVSIEEALNNTQDEWWEKREQGNQAF